MNISCGNDALATAEYLLQALPGLDPVFLSKDLAAENDGNCPEIVQETCVYAVIRLELCFYGTFLLLIEGG